MVLGVEEHQVVEEDELLCGNATYSERVLKVYFHFLDDLSFGLVIIAFSTADLLCAIRKSGEQICGIQKECVCEDGFKYPQHAFKIVVNPRVL